MPFTVEGDSTGPSEVTVDKVKVFELPDGATKGINAFFVFPPDFDFTVDPRLQLSFIVVSTGSGNDDVRLRTRITYIEVTDQIDKAFDQEVLTTKAVVDVVEETHNLTITFAKANIPANPIYGLVNFSRLGSDGADDYEGAIGAIKNMSFEHSREVRQL